MPIIFLILNPFKSRFANLIIPHPSQSRNSGGDFFELTLTYPITGALFDKLQIDRFVKAKPNDTADLQLFRIYEVTKPMNGVVTVNAEHVSYALSNFPVEEINIVRREI